jgi:uncharacterized protein YbgA (DUF1722 family)/uncharacterized protein YbbK (DUF523 family)
MNKIKIGISSCLLGNNVRYDGGHKHDHYITDTLGEYLEFLPVCPEVECGLPIPRESMHLAGSPDSPRLVTIKSGIDHTDKMKTFCTRRVEELASEDLSGFIFKKNSPSSGLHRIKVHGSGTSIYYSRGLFADAFVDRFPLLPVEDEGRLQNPVIRENFLERIIAYNDFKEFLAKGPKIKDLVEFHTSYKLLIMSHSVVYYRSMGKLVAEPKKIEFKNLLEQYQQLFMSACAITATVKKHTNVLMHVMGYFKKNLTGQEKEELLDIITKYHNHYLPLIVPITMLKHYTLRYENDYLAKQKYLNPHPVELMLRNHV